MIAQENDVPVMLQLRDSTKQLHDDTENGGFNQDLVKGRLPREAYIESLAQLFLIHRALESRLRQMRPMHAAFDRVLKDYLFQEPYLREDLAFFDRDADAIRPLPATSDFIACIDRIAVENPVGLLGILYVFEGSNNGSKFISRAVVRAYDLHDGRGTRYLDPYGDRQKAYWQNFKDDMNAAGFSSKEIAAIVDAAGATFSAVMRLHQELYAPVARASAPASMRCPVHHGK